MKYHSLLPMLGGLFVVSSLLGGMSATHLASTAARPPQERNYLMKMLQSSGFRLTPGGVTAWRDARKKELLQKINVLPDSIKAILITRANSSLKYKWPALSDSLYREFKTNGNRSDYEGQMNTSSTALYCLAIGELVTHDPKYMPALVQGLSAIMDERTWVLPAHAETPKPGAGPEDGNIDLIAGETAADLAEIKWMLSDELKQSSPQVMERVQSELNKRILLPYLHRSDFWWMGFNGNVPNNWDPWINSNVLSTALYTQNNEDTLNLVLNKVIRSTDFFINGYPEDGGCDEGPGYWSAAGGKLIRILDMIKSVSGNRLSLKGNALLDNMGTYIYKMHIAGSYFVNFGDAPPKIFPVTESVYMFGDYFGDAAMRGFAAYLFTLNSKAITTVFMNDFLTSADLFGTLAATPPLEPDLSAAWLPDLKILAIRSKTADGELFLGVQGGDNGKSHNHNDVGNFILYEDGNPVIVDAGVGTYTAASFSKDRYTLWNMQSQWHNDPVINGVQQKDGKQYTATGTTYDAQPGKASMSMDIARAYPSEAAVTTWHRAFTFNTSANIVNLDESYELSARKDTTMINFLTCCDVRKIKEGQLAFVDKTGKDVLVMTYDPRLFYIETTIKKMDDAILKSSWGDHLQRISCVVKSTNMKGSGSFVFSIPNSSR